MTTRWSILGLALLTGLTSFAGCRRGPPPGAASGCGQDSGTARYHLVIDGDAYVSDLIGELPTSRGYDFLRGFNQWVSELPSTTRIAISRLDRERGLERIPQDMCGMGPGAALQHLDRWMERTLEPRERRHDLSAAVIEAVGASPFDVPHKVLLVQSEALKGSREALREVRSVLNRRLADVRGSLRCASARSDADLFYTGEPGVGWGCANDEQRRIFTDNRDFRESGNLFRIADGLRELMGR